MKELRKFDDWDTTTNYLPKAKKHFKLKKEILDKFEIDTFYDNKIKKSSVVSYPLKSVRLLKKKRGQEFAEENIRINIELIILKSRF